MDKIRYPVSKFKCNTVNDLPKVELPEFSHFRQAELHQQIKGVTQTARGPPLDAFIVNFKYNAS